MARRPLVGREKLSCILGCVRNAVLVSFDVKILHGHEPILVSVLTEAYTFVTSNIERLIYTGSKMTSNFLTSLTRPYCVSVLKHEAFSFHYRPLVLWHFLRSQRLVLVVSVSVSLLGNIRRSRCWNTSKQISQGNLHPIRKKSYDLTIGR
jgi:hypothetical protein